MPRESVYFDWNATTPPLPAALEAMVRAGQDAWGNPSSVHGVGRRARGYVEDARAAVAALTHADPRDVYFTSGGTEANNLALRSLVGRNPSAVLATSRLEHPSITRVAEALEAEGRVRVRWLAVRPQGDVDLEDVEAALREGNVALVAVQAVNHETGVIQPIDAIARLAEAAGAKLHVDAVQAFGRVCMTAGTNIHSRSLAAHKLQGPKGIGALVVRSDVRIEPLLLGGAQERGIRAGTLDAVLSAGFAVAARHAIDSPARYALIAAKRDAFEHELLAMKADAARNGDAPRAPHVSNVSWPGWVGAELIAALDLEGVCVSSGSACSAGTIEASPVLNAMVGRDRAASSVRVSMGESTTDDDVAKAIIAFREVISR